MTLERLFPVKPCWVLDSSSIINFKSTIAPRNQEDTLRLLDRLVSQRKIAFPRQVVQEVSGQGQNDLPAIWISQNSPNLLHPKSPKESYLQKVLNKVPDLVERDNTKDAADPFILALALQLKDNDWDVCVVTDDYIDRFPRKRSLRNACETMGIKVVQTVEFIETLDNLPQTY